MPLDRRPAGELDVCNRAGAHVTVYICNGHVVVLGLGHIGKCAYSAWRRSRG